MDWEKLRNRERGKAGEDAAPRENRRTLEQDRAAKAAEIRNHPERAPGPVRKLSPEEIERTYGSKVTEPRKVFLDMLRAAKTVAEVDAAARYGIENLSDAERAELRSLFRDRRAAVQPKKKNR